MEHPPRQYAVLGPLLSAADTRGFLGVEVKDGAPVPERPVVVVWVPDATTDDPERLARLQRETAFVTQLRHPHIVPVFGLEYFEEGWARVVAYVDGEPLSVLLQEAQSRGEALPPAIVARIVADVCAGVAFAHHEGQTRYAGRPLVHGGIRPDTVLLAFNGRAQVSGYGAQFAVDEDARHPYLAPEQIIGGKGTASPATDVYAIGALLYALLAGRPPFAGEDLEQEILSGALLPTEDTGARGALERVALAALKKRGPDRYPSVAALAEAITLALDSAGERMASHADTAALWNAWVPPERPQRSGRATLLASASDPDAITLLSDPKELPATSDPALFEAARPRRTPTPAPESGASEDATALCPVGFDPAASAGEATTTDALPVEGTDVDHTDDVEQTVVMTAAAELPADEAAPTEALPIPEAVPSAPEPADAPSLAHDAPPPADAPPPLDAPPARAAPAPAAATPVAAASAAPGDAAPTLRPLPTQDARPKGAVPPPIRPESGVTGFDVRAGDASRFWIWIASALALALIAFLVFAGKEPDEALRAEPTRKALPKALVEAALRGELRDAEGTDAAVPAPTEETPPAASAEAPPPAPESPSTEVAAPGTLDLRSEPNVDVFLGEKRLGRTPLTQALPPGRYRLRMTDRKTGINAYRSYQIKAGATRRSALHFGTSELVVHAPTGARIVLNGKLLGHAPLLPQTIYEGRYVLKVSLDGSQWSKVFEAPPGATIDYRVTLQDVVP